MEVSELERFMSLLVFYINILLLRRIFSLKTNKMKWKDEEEKEDERGREEALLGYYYFVAGIIKEWEKRWGFPGAVVKICDVISLRRGKENE